MNVVGNITKPVPTIKEENKDRYNPCKTIQLYDKAPNTEMSLDMFEEYALRRLKVRSITFLFCYRIYFYFENCFTFASPINHSTSQNVSPTMHYPTL